MSNEKMDDDAAVADSGRVQEEGHHHCPACGSQKPDTRYFLGRLGQMTECHSVWHDIHGTSNQNVVPE
jgi:hypothetical protein